MITHESYIDVDHGAFKGTTSEVIEYLGFGNRSQITQCARDERKFRGHDLKLIGYLKHMMMYGIIFEGTIIKTGTAEELSKIYNVVPCVFPNMARTKGKLNRQYEVVRIQMTDILDKLED